MFESIFKELLSFPVCSELIHLTGVFIQEILLEVVTSSWRSFTQIRPKINELGLTFSTRGTMAIQHSKEIVFWCLCVNNGERILIFELFCSSSLDGMWMELYPDQFIVIKIFKFFIIAFATSSTVLLLFLVSFKYLQSFGIPNLRGILWWELREMVSQWERERGGEIGRIYEKCLILYGPPSSWTLKQNSQTL